MPDQVIAITTQHLLDELAAVLARPKFRRWLTLAGAAAFTGTLHGKAVLHPDPGPLSQRIRDPDDDYLVALSGASGATAVAVRTRAAGSRSPGQTSHR